MKKMIQVPSGLQIVNRIGAAFIVCMICLFAGGKAMARSASSAVTAEKPVKVRVFVSENATKSFRPSSSIAICKGSSARLKVKGNGKYSWSPSASLSDSTGEFVYAYPMATTTYTVTGIDEHGMKVTSTVTVKVNGIPSTNVCPDKSIGEGCSATLTATGGAVYSWAPSAGLSATRGNKVVAAPARTTTYMVTAINKYGCKNSTAVSVVVKGSKEAEKKMASR